MSDADYNPFLQRNAIGPPKPPPSGAGENIPPRVDWNSLGGDVDDADVDSQIGDAEVSDNVEDEESADIYSDSVLPFQYAADSGDRFSKWFWSFASAAFVTTILVVVIIQMVIAKFLLAQKLEFGVSLLIAGSIGVLYGAMHATWRLRKLCSAIRIDEQAIIMSCGKRHQTLDPRTIDAVMALSGIDLNGEGRGFSNLRSLVLLTGAKTQKLSFEPISNARIFKALREACLHAWAIPSEGSLLPPTELAEHHADRAGIDSLRRLRKYYGNYVMQLTFSSVALIVLLIAGGVLVVTTMGLRNLRGGTIRLMIFAGSIILAALSSLRRLPREFEILRKIKQTEKSLAVTLGIEFGR